VLSGVYCTENTTRRDDTDDDAELLYAEDDDYSYNTSVYDRAASRLSEQLLAALAWSSRTSTPYGDQQRHGEAPVNMSRPFTPARRSWERFLAEVVSNLSSVGRHAPHANYTLTTVPPHSSRPLTDHSTSGEPVRPISPSNIQRYHHYHHKHRQRQASLKSRNALPPLNLKSPPAVRLHHLQLTTDKPVSRSGRITGRLAPVTTPPVYLRHRHLPVTSAVSHLQQQHLHHRRHSHEHVITTSNSSHNVTDAAYAITSLFRSLRLATGNDVNVTSSSLTVPDMMHYLLTQATRIFTACMSYLLTHYIHRNVLTRRLAVGLGTLKCRLEERVLPFSK